MRLLRIGFLVVLVSFVSSLAFACPFCDSSFAPPDCNDKVGPSNGCRLTMDGCTSGMHCSGLTGETATGVLAVASVEIRSNGKVDVLVPASAKPVTRTAALHEVHK